MAVLHIVLWHNALVGHPLLVQEVSGDRLLQERITNIFLIRQDLLQCRGQPVIIACRSPDTVSSQPLPDGVVALALQVLPVPSNELWNKAYLP